MFCGATNFFKKLFKKNTPWYLYFDICFVEPLIFSKRYFKKYFPIFCKFCKSRWNDGHCDGRGHGEKFSTGNFAENEMT